MSNQKPIRGTLFGGFNKKDVAGYIEELSKKSGEYKAESEQLRERCDELETYRLTIDELQDDFDHARKELDDANAEIEQLKADKARLEEENSTLSAELAAIKADIEAYKAAREQLVTLELDANRRAVELERDAKATADRILAEARDSIIGLQDSLESIRRDALRMKDGLHAQMAGIESSIDDLAALSRSKQEFLGKYTNREG